MYFGNSRASASGPGGRALHEARGQRRDAVRVDRRALGLLLLPGRLPPGPSMVALPRAVPAARARVGGSHWQQCQGPTRSGFRRTSVILIAPRAPLSPAFLSLFFLIFPRFFSRLAWSGRTRARVRVPSRGCLHPLARGAGGPDRCLAAFRTMPRRGTARRPARQRSRQQPRGRPSVTRPPGGRAPPPPGPIGMSATRLTTRRPSLTPMYAEAGAAGARRRQPAHGYSQQPYARQSAALLPRSVAEWQRYYAKPQQPYPGHGAYASPPTADAAAAPPPQHAPSYAAVPPRRPKSHRRRRPERTAIRRPISRARAPSAQRRLQISPTPPTIPSSTSRTRAGARRSGRRRRARRSPVVSPRGTTRPRIKPGATACFRAADAANDNVSSRRRRGAAGAARASFPADAAETRKRAESADAQSAARARERSPRRARRRRPRRPPQPRPVCPAARRQRVVGRRSRRGGARLCIAGRGFLARPPCVETDAARQLRVQVHLPSPRRRRALHHLGSAVIVFSGGARPIRGVPLDCATSGPRWAPTMISLRCSGRPW